MTAELNFNLLAVCIGSKSELIEQYRLLCTSAQIKGYFKLSRSVPNSLSLGLLTLFADIPRPGDSEVTLRSLSQAATCHLSTT